MNPVRVADLSPLLLNEPQSYYWMGFLIADGTFYEKALKLHLAEADREHLEKFKRFVSYSGKAKTCSVSLMHPEVVPMIREKFDIRDRKTYSPCDLSHHSGDMLFSLIMGLIDGDGTMAQRKGSVSGIAIKLHSSWIDQLVFIEKFLYDYFDMKREKSKGLTRINKAGYALLMLTDRFLLAKIKGKVLEMNLPVMERKWALINVDYKGRIRKCSDLSISASALRDSGCSLKEIAEIMNTSYRKVIYLVGRTRYLNNRRSKILS